MPSFALQIIIDPDDGQGYRWVVLEQDTDDAFAFRPHSSAECDFDEWASALDAGTLALAAAEGQPYENEAADPVGDADCSAAN